MFDSKCYDLAEEFLEEEDDISEPEIRDLAQTIQDAIEDWILAMRRGKMTAKEEDEEARPL